ncbi:hypothetical protein KKA09_00240 [Patescibacteria group bacterium]|nr:hypothetical protein [Patescibacteria group bacterium]
MNLPKEDVELFFKLHPALLQYVNQRLAIFPDIKTAEQLRTSGVENIGRVQTKLWKRKDFINDFVTENPFNFLKEELAIVASWKYALQGKFYIFRHLKKYSVFLTETEPIKAYGVCSLNTPLSEMFWNLPVYTKAVLVPFQGHIIYDGILYSYATTFGPGFRFNLNEDYREAKNKFGIIETFDI